MPGTGERLSVSEADAGRGRRFLVPEVVQTSAMDCGPASLKSLLEGFRLNVGYDRLREACQTDVDGTSIDTMEEVAQQLGLDAEQVMVPPDHLFVPAAHALPGILVVANAIGVTHFIVVWRRVGSWVQVMDPGVGRHWTRLEGLLRRVYHHRMAVPSAAWRDWAGSEEFQQTLMARMASLGLTGGSREELLARVGKDQDWRPIAALDAAVRMTAAIVASGGLTRGKPAASLIHGVLDDELSRAVATVTGVGDEVVEEPIPDVYWSVRHMAADAEGTPLLQLRGAVLVRAKGLLEDRGVVNADSGEARPAGRGLSPELAAALSEPTIHPLRELLRTVLADGRTGPLVFIAALASAAAVTVVQVLFFRGLLDLGGKLVLPEQRLMAAGALLLFLVLGLAIEIPTARAVLAYGRRLEVRLRQRFLEKTAKLADRYFRSRLASDMAERSHSTHALHEVPEVAAALLRLLFQALLTTAGIIWLDPGVAGIALLALAFSVGLPFFSQPLLAETDLRVRIHAGALSRFYLDALLGLVPARNHGAERSMRREHESLLLEWNLALLRSEGAKLVMSCAQSLLGYSLAILLVFRHLSGVEGVGQILLLAYWALHLQTISENLGVVARQVPHYRNITRRLLEPLRMDDAETSSLSTPPVSETAQPPRPVGSTEPLTEGVKIGFKGVRLVAGGHRILEGVDLEIDAGSHVAVVGPSGAGKSSLVGLLLGWHQAAAGEVRIDGELLDAARLAELRHETAWVDPAIQLWNRPLLTNLRYGSGSEADPRIGSAIDTALLRGLLEKLPTGLQTSLGEGGALVSGGEGQRVRLARALLRAHARLVILDEPFRGLDRSQRRQLTRRAREWWQDKTLFYVSHDLAETRAFDQVLVIEDGQITESGKPADLEANSESRYASLLAAEEKIRQELAEGARWRHWRVADGRINESQSVAKRGAESHGAESHDAESHGADDGDTDAAR